MYNALFIYLFIYLQNTTAQYDIELLTTVANKSANTSDVQQISSSRGTSVKNNKPKRTQTTTKNKNKTKATKNKV